MTLGTACSSESNLANSSTQHSAAVDIHTGDLAQTPSKRPQQVANGSKSNALNRVFSAAGNSTNTPVAPPTKKAKTVKAVQVVQWAPKSRRRETLSSLFNMPLDVLFEVLGHLAPKDLINVSRTTKTLRATLLDKSATTVWKTSRQRLGGPDPPRDMPEPRWTILIFTTTCTSCGVNNAKILDFLLQRRMCKKCKQHNLISNTNVRDEFPGINMAILDLISPSFDNDSFWRQDIGHISKTIRDYDARIVRGDKDAVAELKNYQDARTRVVKDMRQDAINLTAWMDNVTRQKLQLKEASMFQQKITIATERFRSLGYLDDDMPNMTSEREITQKGRMTEKVWGRLRRRVEPSYFRNKELRREREGRMVRHSRREMADKVYRSYAMTIPSSQWKYLPSTEVVCGLRPFRDLITVDVDVPVTEASFAACIGDLPRVLETAVLDMKRRHIGASPPLFPGQDMSDASMQKAFTMLELVKNSSQCHTNSAKCDQVLYGWDEISSHHCLMESNGTMPGASPLNNLSIGIFDDYSPRFLEEFPNWSRYHRGMMVYVAYVARVSGFQGMSATVEQMDNSDLRYACSLCDIASTKAVAYSWRSCAEHLNRKHSDREARFRGLLKSNPTTRRTGDGIVTILSQTDTDWVKAKERELERGPDSKWACTHCPVHLTHSVPYTDVIQHVKAKHGIDQPGEVVDLISLRRVRKNYSIYYKPVPPSG